MPDRAEYDESTIFLDLPPAWGRPEIAHMVLTRMFVTRERVEIRDAACVTWSLERASVRSFWMRL